MNDTYIPSAPITIACAQAQPIAGDIVANIGLVVEMVREAGQAGAAIIQFPEKFLSGYEPELIQSDVERYAVAADDIRLAPIFEACREHRIAAVVGAATRERGGLHVSSLIVDRCGRLRGFYHKQFLFQTERAIYEAGRDSIALDIDGWKFGLAICYDSGFPEHARAAANEGCHAYLASALFSQGNGFHESRVWFPARALDNTMFVALSNHVGTTGGWNTCGASAIWSPDGRVLAEASSTDRQLVVATLEPSALRDVRGRETMVRDFPQYATSLGRPFELMKLDTTGG